jgi:hypothetical protein
MKRVLLFVLLIASLVPAAANAQSDASIKILKPGDRRNVELGEVTVTVEITGAALSDGYAWQMLIDSVPQGVVRDGMTAEIVVPKPSGPHRLKAELYDSTGMPVSSHEILVMAAPVENREPVFNRAWFDPFGIIFTITIIVILLLALRLRPRMTT